MRKNYFLNHLVKELKTHLWQYLLLLTISVFFLVLFSFTKSSRLNQFFVLTLFVVFYILWGIIHHLLEKTLNLKIVVEYIFIGFLVLFLLQNLLIH